MKAAYVGIGGQDLGSHRLEAQVGDAMVVEVGQDEPAQRHGGLFPDVEAARRSVPLPIDALQIDQSDRLASGDDEPMAALCRAVASQASCAATSWVRSVNM